MPHTSGRTLSLSLSHYQFASFLLQLLCLILCHEFFTRHRSTCTRFFYICFLFRYIIFFLIFRRSLKRLGFFSSAEGLPGLQNLFCLRFVAFSKPSRCTQLSRAGNSIWDLRGEVSLSTLFANVRQKTSSASPLESFSTVKGARHCCTVLFLIVSPYICIRIDSSLRKFTRKLP